jgi:hypothetical protein
MGIVLYLVAGDKRLPACGGILMVAVASNNQKWLENLPFF